MESFTDGAQDDNSATEESATLVRFGAIRPHMG